MSAVLEVGAPAFRSLKEADVDTIMQVEVRAYSHPWTAGIFRDCMRVGYYCQVMEIDGAIEAYGVMSLGAGEAHILNLTVRPESQGQGYGRTMLNHLLDMARRLHADIALLEVRPSNKAAIGLYDSMGFSEVGARRNYYPADDGREDALILALNL
jgi:ribosomal-protein-alanine N-acetyltransferase